MPADLEPQQIVTNVRSPETSVPPRGRGFRPRTHPVGVENSLGRVPEALAVATLALLVPLVAGIVTLGAPSVVPSLLLVTASVGALIVSGIAIIAPDWQAANNSYLVDEDSDNLEERIEALEDLRWQARDNADRLQAMLDGQDDIVIRRDERGRITFANRAFCLKFSIGQDDAIGKPFHPTVIGKDADDSKSDNAADPTGHLPFWAHSSIEEIATEVGPRWIKWTHRHLGSSYTGDSDIQSVGRDITEQRRHERDLARARDEARAADLAKSRFLASMSHEIRTPMNGILGMSGLLAETNQSPEQRTYTQAVRKSAVTLLALIDEILDFSKIEAGHVELASAPVDIIDCVQGAVELLAPRAYQKELQLAWSVAPDMPRLYLGDEFRLRQILLNLIGNAVKFTETGGITVWMGSERLDSKSDSIKIAVRDTGPGLSEDACTRIFKEFERAAPAGKLNESGTGLGLAIAERIARNMGGGITVSSRPEEGATFTLVVRLPRAEAIEEGASVMPKLPDGATFAVRHVAIVSSHAIERCTLANFLRANHVAVSERANVADVAMLRDEPDAPALDMILFDADISPKEAADAIAALAGPNAEPPRAAVITSTRDRDQIAQFSADGIAHFLVRPIRPTTLLALMSGNVESTTVVNASSERDGIERSCSSDKHLSWRILVAEDNEINALLTRTVLQRLGCDPVIVTDGREAIDAVARSVSGAAPSFDAILMDLHMPQADGFEATDEIRQLCDAASVKMPPVIAVTANAFQEDRDRCLAAGMDGYLAKPFEPGDLKRVLDAIATNRGV